MYSAIDLRIYTAPTVPPSQAEKLFLAVVDQDVRSILGNTLDNILQAVLGNILAETINLLALTEEIGANASDVWASHGCTRDGVGLATDPGALNVSAWGKYVDNFAKVRVLSQLITLVGSSDGADALLRGRGRGRGIRSFVSGSNGKEETSTSNASSSLVDSGRGRATKRHIHNDTLGAVLGSGILGNKVHACDDAGAT